MARVAIVGGGITGCIAALECADRGHTVDLYEMSPRLGGVMQDVVQGTDHYFNGCHYFDRGTPWFEAVRNRVACDFEDFVHEYGSLTSMLGEVHRHDDFAQPLFGGPTPEFLRGTRHVATVGERLDAYPSAIAQALRAWSSGFGEPDQLHADCIQAMQLGRLFFYEDPAGVQREKTRSPTADDLLGLPRTLRDPGGTKAIASLPRDGYDMFFNAVGELLNSLGVSIRVSAPVAPLARPDGTLLLRALGQALSADHVIWCTNPTALLIAAGVGKLDSPVSDMFALVSDLERKPVPQTVYHQIFSDSSSVVRVFVYDLSGPKVTIEGFDQGQDDAAILNDVTSVLAQLDLPAMSGPTAIQRQKRYVNFTVRDLTLFERFESVSADMGIVPGGWQFYSRDRKVDSIIGRIAEWGTA